VTDGETIAPGGWRLRLSRQSEGLPRDIRARLEQMIAKVADRDTGYYRRSRHARTFLLRVRDENRRDRFVGFLKIYDRPRGLDATKRMLRGSRVAHIESVSRALRERGFGVPTLVLLGQHRETGRELVVTERARGVSLDAILDTPGKLGLVQKRKVLYALGAQIARLHRAGYIHGDLTPYNVFVASDEPPQFTFIDHDRTRRAFIAGRRRQQLRNLVQLFRFDLAAMSHADRVRIFRAWAGGLGLGRERALMRRFFRMLNARLARDRASVRSAAGTASAEPPSAQKTAAVSRLAR
jgi:serine/threonine protein kinase